MADIVVTLLVSIVLRSKLVSALQPKNMESMLCTELVSNPSKLIVVNDLQF